VTNIKKFSCRRTDARWSISLEYWCKVITKMYSTLILQRPKSPSNTV